MCVGTTFGKIAEAILPKVVPSVNSEIVILIDIKNFDIDSNDLLENIEVLTKYILSKKQRKIKRKNILN